MRCHRCDGLLVLDHFVDMGDNMGQLWMRAWRCVNCGAVEDPVIGRHHHHKRSGALSVLKRRPQHKPALRETIRLTA